VQCVVAFLVGLSIVSTTLAAETRPAYQSPYAVVMAPDGSRLYVSHHTGGVVSVVDPASRKVVRKIAVGGSPAGLALSADGSALYAADADDGSVALIDTRASRVSAKIDGGRSAFGLELSRDGRRLYVCDRFLNRVNVVDTAKRKAIYRLPATREPLCCALEPDGQTLYVSNMLPLGPATDPANAAVVDLYDPKSFKHLGELKLPPGTTDVHQVSCSPDGKWVYVVHVVARFNVPPTQLERGWVNNSGLTIIDAHKRRVFATLLLDEASRGSANPFAAAFTPEGRTLAVSFFGTHEVALIDLVRLHEALAKEKPERLPQLVNELSLLTRYGAIRRAPTGGRGPRGIAIEPKGRTLYVANCYSDNLGVVDIERGRLAGTVALGPPAEPDVVRRGGPVMASGVRAKMEAAVRAGLRHILFRQVNEDEAQAIDAYLRALKSRPSPYRGRDGSLTPAARRGKKIFFAPKTGCAVCHPAPLYTDLKLHDVGTGAPLDRRETFDNPSLIEIWRTGPYLHDGRAVTLHEVLSKFNKGDRHGRTSHLSKKELDDLAAFLLSL